MYPSDPPPGYVETWRKIISVYPPIPVETLAAALAAATHPPATPARPRRPWWQWWR